MTSHVIFSTTIHAHNAVRSTTPLIQCLTNTVVQQFTANVLLASGAAPAMVDIPVEAGIFAGAASATLINLGTLSPIQAEAMPEAAAAASTAGHPWVLDPVAIGALPIRTQLAVDLLEYRPACIRGNASEIIALDSALRGVSVSGGRGPESADDVDAAADSARTLAKETGAVVAVSGPVDLITDGTVTVRCANGSPMLTLVTGGGCALGAYIAAHLTTDVAPLDAVAAAHATYGIAAELAAEVAAGPGSFGSAFLDRLHALDADTIVARLELH